MAIPSDWMPKVKMSKIIVLSKQRVPLQEYQTSQDSGAHRPLFSVT